LTHSRFDGFSLVQKKDVLKMYAFDLKERINPVEAEALVDVSVHGTPVKVGRLPRSVIESRLEKGDKIFIAEHNNEPVAYLFAATSNTYIGEIDDWLMVNRGEVYLYDAFTAPEFRGRRIYPHLITEAAVHFKNRGYEHALIFSTVQNILSIKGITRCGFKCYKTVWFRNFLGWKSWRYQDRERFVDSRLSSEN
jgi:ribosomal protein S18 acetylase RimI-like enzyme